MSLPFARAHIESLPFLKAMMERGAFAPLRSVAGLMSASGWPTFAAGIDPGEHGHYHPFQWDADAMTFRRVSDRIWSERFHFEPFWHRLARAGVEACVLDAGFVLHDERAPCIQLSNWSGQESGAASASDPALMAELRRRFGRRPIGAEVPVPKTRRQSRKIRDRLIRSVRQKGEAILWLMQQSEWRFFLASFFEAHRGGHNLWPTDGAFGSDADPEALLEVYKEIDRQLARAFDAAASENTTLILFALHGMDENRAQNHFTPKILRRLNARYLEERGGPAKRRAGRNVVALLRKFVPYSVQYWLAQALGERVQDWVINRELVGGLDWSKTPSFHMTSGGEGYIRLNIKGRERDGFFDPDSDEINDYKKWLRERLLRIKVAATGEPLISEIHEMKTLFPGSRVDRLPDLALIWAPTAPAEKIISPDIGEITERLATGRGGNHTEGSFMIVEGPGAHSATLAKVSHIREIGGFVESLFSDAGSAHKGDAARQSRVSEPT